LIQKIELPDAKNIDILHDSKTWIEPWKEISRFLSLNMQSNSLKEKHKDSVWNILKQIAKEDYAKDKVFVSSSSSRSGKEWEKETRIEYYNSAINNIYGVNVESIIQYALWLRRTLGKETDINKVKNRLEIILNETEPKNYHYICLAIFMRFLPWISDLFPVWTLENLNKFLPKDPEKLEKFNIAWRIYIMNCQIYGDMWEKLEDRYEYSIVNLPEEGNNKEYLNRLGHHLGNVYLWGKYDISSSLMKEIFKKKEMSKSLITFISNNLKNLVNPNKKLLINLWENRYKYLKEKNLIVKSIQELNEFWKWYTTPIFDYKWRIKNCLEVCQKGARFYFYNKNFYGQIIEDLKQYTFEVVEDLIKILKSQLVFRGLYDYTSEKENINLIFGKIIEMSKDKKWQKEWTESFNEMVNGMGDSGITDIGEVLIKKEEE